MLLAFPTSVLTFGLNILAVALGIRLLEGRPVVATFLEVVRLVLAAELFSAILTVAAVLVTVKLHLLGLIVLGLFLGITQYLLGELITSAPAPRATSHDGDDR